MPKISILMSTFNDAQTLSLAIDSVLEQSFKDWELLIVNDFSNDSTQSILQTYQQRDPRISFWSNPSQKGLIANLNFGLAKAQGEFIARLDSDDYWIEANKLQKQLDFLEKNQKYCLVGTWAEVINLDNNKIYNFMPPEHDPDIRKEILWHNCFVHSSILARKKNMLDAGGYDVNQKYVEDYALWLKMGASAMFANLPQTFLRYRVKPDGITQTKNLQQISAALALADVYKSRYGGWLKAKVKWRLQWLLTAILGARNLVKFRTEPKI